MSARRSRTRRWHIPPLPPIEPERSLAAAILRETAGEMGVLLWRTLRTVHAWGTTPPADRPLLFSPDALDRRMADLLAAAPDPAVESPLRMLAALTGDPVGIDADRVALACLGVAAWAQDAGRPATCAEFTFAAVLACPGSPIYALASARESRDHGRHEEAEAMYQRVIALARQLPDWDSYVRAHAGLGKLAQARGAYPSARKSLLRAYRAAERHHLRTLRAMVLHDLFTVEVDCGSMGEAERYAEAAVAAYGSQHAMLPILAFDIAVYWVDQGRFREALPVFREVLPRLAPEQQVNGWGNIARAAGGMGDGNTFEIACERVMAAPESSPRKVDALRETAYGAFYLGYLDRAAALSREALVLAHLRGDHKTVFVGETLLTRIEDVRSGSVVHETTVQEAPARERLLSDILVEKLGRASGAVPS
ncbi:MAG TPA: tetratricopeptide repeat protein [Longimicrobiaceae bacterium]|nr:tetratricopeptide repeat protein [Longimicrobiaceae bacterium]